MIRSVWSAVVPVRGGQRVVVVGDAAQLDRLGGTAQREGQLSDGGVVAAQRVQSHAFVERARGQRPPAKK
ncbi:hypothetical protein [Kitasatospora griseola]|uniref:hypothetical protein n=1 Tax=Kitasatospora griseola TaxID=2064 RepID=UPI00341746BD